MRRVTEALPNDGAPYKCHRRVPAGPMGRCGKPAVRALTKEAFDLLDDLFVMRAVCADHATEAAMELDGEEES